MLLAPGVTALAESNPDDDAIGAVVKGPGAVIVASRSLEILGTKRMVREICGTVRGRRDAAKAAP